MTLTEYGLTLRAGEAVFGPAQGVVICSVQQSVLLLNPEPGVRVLGFLHHLITRVTIVGF